MTLNEFNLLYAVKKNGMQSCRNLSSLSGTSLGYVSETLKEFNEKGYVDDKGITEKGIEALAPYKVKNAVIMAAGMSSRFVPLSLEKPKGLLIVKNEVLIERQIEQLREAGIKEIVVVLGYKKEAFFYLEDKYDVKIIINPEFNTKNNIETLYLAQKYIGNTYICSSDDYFEENVFEEYVYQSYYAAIHVYEKTNEYYMIPDAKGNVAQVKKSGVEGSVMLGHVYWDNKFSEAFIKLINEHHDIGDYDANLWEDLFADNVKKLPPMYIKEYPDDVIFEFDSLEDLRKFDAYYVDNTHSKIMKNISKVMECKESDILDFMPIKEGLTNTSFVFEVFGKKYVYRHPGDGTEEIISRKREKSALELAKSIEVDPTFIYMDDNEGWKISSFVEGIRMPDYASFEDSKRVIAVMRQLHDKNLMVDWEFRPWEEALKIEELIRAKGEIAASDFDDLKAKVEKCYNATVGDGVEMRFCHCDTYCPNWMLTEDKTILIDWEYAGNADPGCDTGAYIMDAMYDVEESTKFIKEYCGADYNDTQLFHHLAYVAIVSYYWFVWALYREACGAVMGESLHNWYVMAKRYANYLVDKI
ncbi:MAG: phosphotransferase [Clostridia bacterium]|nr:phosphotransferase [Clostridia bacterium]